MKNFACAVLATVCLGLAGCSDSSTSLNPPSPESVQETRLATPVPSIAGNTLVDYDAEHLARANAEKAGAFDLLSEISLGLVSDPRRVMSRWISSINSLEGSQPSTTIRTVEWAVFGPNWTYQRIAEGIVRRFLSRLENVRFVRELVKTQLYAVQISPETRKTLISGSEIFAKPFKMMQIDMEAWYSQYRIPPYSLNAITDAPSDWTEQYGDLDEKKMWWYMWLYRRYQEGGMPLVEEWQGFANESLIALNAQPPTNNP